MPDPDTTLMDALGRDALTALERILVICNSIENTDDDAIGAIEDIAQIVLGALPG